MNNKMKFGKNKPFRAKKERCYKAANSFRKMLPERKSGWYRGSVDYYLNEEGRIEHLDETKILFSEQDLPSQKLNQKQNFAQTTNQQIDHLDETKNQTSSGDYITPQDDNETSFGDGNFTLEGFIDDFRIKNKGWRSVTFARKLCNFFIHTTETVNGVDYIVVIELDDDGHLVKKEYTLASRVRG